MNDVFSKARPAVGFTPMSNAGNGYLTPLRTEAAKVYATPFQWTDPATIPTRPWVYGHHMIRKDVSLTVAPGGVGKSSLSIAEVMALVTGQNLLGEYVPSAMRVWYWNLEDNGPELQRRFAAAALHHKITPADLENRLFVDTGRESPLCIATQTRDGATILRPVVDALEDELKARKIDVLIIDPFVSSHAVTENDNNAMDLVAKEWGRIADRCNCAIELVHHTRKLAAGEVATTGSGRGASALVDASRSARVLQKMTDDERIAANIPDDDLGTYFTVTRDKANLAPVTGRKWFRTVGVDLGNGPLAGMGGDSVASVESWKWPDTFDGINTGDVLRMQQALDGTQYRKDPQASRWVGFAIADALDLDPKKSKARIASMVKTWLESGVLRTVTVLDERKREKPGVEVGEWITEE